MLIRVELPEGMLRAGGDTVSRTGDRREIRMETVRDHQADTRRHWVRRELEELCRSLSETPVVENDRARTYLLGLRDGIRRAAIGLADMSGEEVDAMMLEVGGCN
jgi:hypothetical protein